MTDFTTEFMRGQQDCMDGNPHQSGQSEEYDRGYAAQYELEEVTTALSEMVYEC